MKRRSSMVMIFVIASTLITLGASGGYQTGADEAESVTVFAAASTTNAITEIGALFRQKGMGKVLSSFASSSTLAKQIENGAPAHVFISADEDWMNYLAKRKLVDTSTRSDLAGNSLVLVAPMDSNATVKIAPGFGLAGILGESRLAMGDPDHVPAGKYGKAALEKLGVWSQVAGRLARASDVRGALALVERGEAGLGIVYATDATISKKVKIVGEFPSDTYPPVVYPAALVASRDSAAAGRFIAFLKGPEAREVFRRLGFAVR